MKTTLFLSFISILFGANARADFKLLARQKNIVCYGGDNQSLNLNANRTRIKYTVEGESLGAKKIIDVNTDYETFVTYTTSELTLTLSDEGDSFHYKGDQVSQGINCK